MTPPSKEPSKKPDAARKQPSGREPSPAHERAPQRDKGKKRPRVRTHTPRPDELTRETFEFIAAVDEYKRRFMRSFLDDSEVLKILFDLGYRPADCEPIVTDELLGALADERHRYRVEQGRLFPTWSEVFELLMKLGYSREEKDSAA